MAVWRSHGPERHVLSQAPDPPSIPLSIYPPSPPLSSLRPSVCLSIPLISQLIHPYIIYRLSLPFSNHPSITYPSISSPLYPSITYPSISPSLYHLSSITPSLHIHPSILISIFLCIHPSHPPVSPFFATSTVTFRHHTHPHHKI